MSVINVCDIYPSITELYIAKDVGKRNIRDLFSLSQSHITESTIFRPEDGRTVHTFGMYLFI